MVELTIDNATMPIPNRKSHITNLQARPLVPFVPDVLFVPSVRDVSDVSNVSDVRDVSGVSANARCPKKNRTPSNAKFRVGGPRVSKGLSPNAIFGILESRDSKLNRVSGVSTVSCDSSVSSVSTVSETNASFNK